MPTCITTNRFLTNLSLPARITGTFINSCSNPIQTISSHMMNSSTVMTIPSVETRTGIRSYTHPILAVNTYSLITSRSDPSRLTVTYILVYTRAILTDRCTDRSITIPSCPSILTFTTLPSSHHVLIETLSEVTHTRHNFNLPVDSISLQSIGFRHIITIRGSNLISLNFITTRSSCADFKVYPTAIEMEERLVSVMNDTEIFILPTPVVYCLVVAICPSVEITYINNLKNHQVVI